jgi:hypothetical protein
MAIGVGEMAINSEENRTTWRPTLVRILMMDYVAVLGIAIAVAAPAVLVLAYAGLLGEQTDEDIMFWVVAAILGILVGTSIVALRVRSILDLFSRAVEVRGAIVRVWFTKDRGRVDYRYTFRGRDYSSGKAIMRNRRTAALESGRDIVVVVDPQNPRRSFIRDLYAEP